MRSGEAGAAGRRRRGWRERVATAVLAVVTLAAAACTGGDDVPEHSAADAPVRTTSTTVAPPPGLQRLAATSSLGDEEGSRFTDVAVGERAILVLGDGGGRAAMWTTTDGMSYDPVPLSRLDFPDGTVLSDAAVTTERFVVVGSDGSGAAAWTSTDGRAWSRTDLADGSAVDVVLVGELGVTAYGRDGADVATWVSFEGERWQRVPGGAAVLDGGGGRVVGAHDDGDGFVVAVDRGGVAEVWRSPDGRTWAQEPGTGAELLPAVGAPLPSTLLGAGSTAVVLGAVDDPDGRDAAVWSSLSGGPWERAAPSEAVFGGDGAQEIAAATQLGAQLVAVGTDTDITGDVDAVVWTTAPTGGWQRAELGGPGDQHPAAIAATRRGALVVGWEEAGGVTRAMAWALAEGEAEPAPPATAPALAWRRVPTGDGLGGPDEQRLHAVVATGDGFVGVGAAVPDGQPAGDVDGAVWRSADGTGWGRVEDPGGALAGPGLQQLRGVIVGGPGLVAVGTDAGAAAVWTSPHGDLWSRVAHDEAVFGGAGDQEAVAVAAGPDGSLVAVGRDAAAGDGDAAVWRSLEPGAGAWERVDPGGQLGGPGRQEATSVVRAGGLLVAVGASDGVAVAWTSVDGRDWSRHDLGPGRAEAVVASGATGGQLVAVGSAPAEAAGELDAAAWHSADGASWAPAVLDDGALGLADQEALAVAEVVWPDGQPLLAAVGRTGLGPGDDGAAWTSGDGLGWERSPHDEDVYGGDQDQRMVAVAVRGEVAVAVGWSGSEPAARDAAVWVDAPGGDGGGVL